MCCRLYERFDGVIKVEAPGGDYARRMTWPIIRSQDGAGENSLLFLHINRGKRSVVLDLRQPDGVEAYLESEPSAADPAPVRDPP
jgi:crotonobetainyl-CoA:carnitine CoA-transferase CaiB-like acyl-CoA transferase